MGFYANLTALVEGAVAASGGTKAMLLAHSMGNLVSLAFLRMHTPAWRAQHIAALVALSGPWGGSVTALKGACSPSGVSRCQVPVCNEGILASLASCS